MSQITVHKRDHTGQHVLSYSGQVIEWGEHWVCLQATFGHDDADAGMLVLRRGDQMTEWFYSDRFYNVFMIQQADSGQVKGWYCNITRPAEITPHAVASDDLALDVVVLPSGEVSVLDQEEFAALDLPAGERQAAWDAVAELREMAAAAHGPFRYRVAQP